MSRKHILLNRFPGKQLFDAGALVQMLALPTISPRHKAECLKFYFAGGSIRNLSATLTRSGQAWTDLTIALALDLAAGGDGDYRYMWDFWVPNGGVRYTKLDWRIPCDTALPPFVPPYIKNPIYYHTHHPYFRVRSAQLKNMRIVVRVRSILESLESNFFKLSSAGIHPEISAANEDSFPWEHHLGDAIEFFNSWGDVATWHPRCLVLKYHDLKADPVGTHKEMLDFWGVSVPEDCIKEALARTTKIAMRNKLGGEAQKSIKEGAAEAKVAFSPRVSLRKERGVISQKRFRWIIDRLRADLIHDFGYDYNYDMPYGQHYD